MGWQCWQRALASPLSLSLPVRFNLFQQMICRLPSPNLVRRYLTCFSFKQIRDKPSFLTRSLLKRRCLAQPPSDLFFLICLTLITRFPRTQMTSKPCECLKSWEVAAGRWHGKCPRWCPRCWNVMQSLPHSVLSHFS